MRILTYPDPTLKEVCEPVEDVDEEVRKDFDKMVYAMRAHRGIGLAANQIGIMKRLIVMDLSAAGIMSGTMYLANPEITHFSKETQRETEGCLSFPKVWGKVTRSKTIDLKYLDYYGNQITIEAVDLLAACVQHEVDHLNGITFHDHLSPLKRKMNEKKMGTLRKLGLIR